VDFWKGWPYPVAVAALFVVVMLRAGGTYAIGRAAQEGVRRSRLSRAMSKPRFARMQQMVARWGAPVVTLSFLTVGIQTLVNLAAGVMRMPLRRYIPALTIGAILWAFLYATVGFATFAGWRRVYQLSPTVAIVTLVVLLAGLAGYIVWQVRHRDDEDEREPANLGALAAHLRLTLGTRWRRSTSPISHITGPTRRPWYGSPLIAQRYATPSGHTPSTSSTPHWTTLGAPPT
jgi:membrane protein DedA with SNARE-associated domain